MNKSIESLLGWIIVAILYLTNIFILPNSSQDPFNVTRLLIVSTGGVSIGFAILNRNVFVLFKHFRLLILSICLFMTAVLLSLLVSKTENIAEFYGAFGRNTGLLAYISLAIVMLGSAIAANSEFVKHVLNALLGIGLLNILYGLFQYFGLDPIDWVSTLNPIIGIYGNPNFMSAFLGFVGTVSTVKILQQDKAVIFRMVHILITLLSIFLMLLSESNQGLLIWIISLYLVAYYKYFRLSIFKYYYLFLGTLVGIISALGLLNKGLAANFLYQVSVSYRGDYWRAAWAMFIDNPIFGQGLDSYGLYYRFFRDELAISRRGPDITTNAAHNVYLDMLSNGGIILFTSYVVINLIVFRSALRILRKEEYLNVSSLCIVLVWLSYQIQSLVSINNLAIAIWGWIFGGIIVGIDMKKALVISNLGSKSVLKKIVFNALFGGILGLIIAAPPFIQDLKFKSALETRSVEPIKSTALFFPRNSYYLTYAANIFNQNELYTEARSMAEAAINSNRREFGAWEALLQQPNLTQIQRRRIITKLQELDPRNSQLKTLQIELEK